MRTKHTFTHSHKAILSNFLERRLILKFGSVDLSQNKILTPQEKDSEITLISKMKQQEGCAVSIGRDLNNFKNKVAYVCADNSDILNTPTSKHKQEIHKNTEKISTDNLFKINKYVSKKMKEYDKSHKIINKELAQIRIEKSEEIKEELIKKYKYKKDIFGLYPEELEYKVSEELRKENDSFLSDKNLERNLYIQQVTNEIKQKLFL